MRLVSAYYNEFYPFDIFPKFESFHATNNPDDLQEEDVLIVWGGSDIWNGYYNKPRSPMNMCGPQPSKRDMIEWAMISRAKSLNIPIIGICRGAQMLCAAAGGYLIQHVAGHGGTHEVVTNNGRSYLTNSLHHQMMVADGTNHEVLAEIPRDALRSEVYWDGNDMVERNQEPEFIYFNDIKGFAVQWHPEMMAANTKATRHVFEEMEKRLG